MCIHLFVFSQGQVNLLKVHVSGLVYWFIKHLSITFFIPSPSTQGKNFIFSLIVYYSITDNFKDWGSLREVASITLRNAHKENKRAKSECSFTRFCFLNYC